MIWQIAFNIYKISLLGSVILMFLVGIKFRSADKTMKQELEEATPVNFYVFWSIISLVPFLNTYLSFITYLSFMSYVWSDILYWIRRGIILTERYFHRKQMQNNGKRINSRTGRRIS